MSHHEFSVTPASSPTKRVIPTGAGRLFLPRSLLFTPDGFAGRTRRPAQWRNVSSISPRHQPRDPFRCSSGVFSPPPRNPPLYGRSTAAPHLG